MLKRNSDFLADPVDERPIVDGKRGRLSDALSDDRATSPVQSDEEHSEVMNSEGQDMPDSPSATKCTSCGKSYKSLKQLRTHFRDCHEETGTVRLNDGSSVFVKREKDKKLHCHACRANFVSKSGIRKHFLDKVQCSELAKINENIVSGSTFSKDLLLTLPERRRTLEEGILHAQGVEDGPESIKLRTLLATSQLGMSPVGISIGGVETSFTVSAALYDMLPDKPFVVSAHKSVPDNNKRGLIIDRNCTNCSSPPTTPVMDLIRQSPFARILETRSFKELNKKASTYLNLDWSRYPQAGYITAHLLSGSVITNIQSGQTILVNEVEFYGRDAMLDCHKEPTGEQKGVPEKTSIPSTTGEEYYKRVRPVTLRRRDGVRLVIGTNTCGVLVTSCIRVDRILEGSISVGGDTRNFEISESELKNIRVFVDNERLGKGKKMKKKTVKKITKDFGADRLRQVRSKFHRLNTFRLIRCSGPLTDAPQFRPFSVFTIGRNSDRDSASSGAAHIFYKMALAVIHYQEKATFTLEDIRFGQQLCQSAKDISIPMQNIHELFAEVDTKIPIIGNKPLNKQLHAIAEAQSTRIAKANKNVATELKDLFLG